VPETFKPSGAKPTLFDAYWDELNHDLSAVPPAAIVDPLPIRSTEFAICYEVYLTSIGPYRLFSYYTVPKGDGPFPAILHTPGYASVVGPAPHEERRQYITMSLSARGQRRSDHPFAASFPGQAIIGIEEPSSFIYRGIIADTLRAIDFLQGRREVDCRRITLIGSDTALVGAALRPTVKAVQVTDPAFYAARDLAPRTEAYPQEEWNELSRTRPDLATAMWETLAYFDPLFFAPRVAADVRLSVGPPGSVFSRATAAPLVAAISGKVDVDERTGYGYLDYRRAIGWRDEHA